MRKLTVKERKHLQKLRDDFLSSLRARIDVMIWVGDVDQFDRLLTQVEILGAYEISKIIHDKGLDKELQAIVEKAGQISSVQSNEAEKK
jgi:CRP-like cAMP-binding protein